jgi:hypothetical protein
MKIFKKLSLLVALLVPLLLTSCGGSSSCSLSGLAFGLVACKDGGNGGDQTLYEDQGIGINPFQYFIKLIALQGVENERVAEIHMTTRTDTENDTALGRFGYFTHNKIYEKNISELAKFVDSEGWMAQMTVSQTTLVSTKNNKKWCFTENAARTRNLNAISCYLYGENYFISDIAAWYGDRPFHRQVTIYMTGLVPNQRTIIRQYPADICCSDVDGALISVSSKDPNLTQEPDWLDRTKPTTHLATAINGQWIGFKGTYDIQNRTLNSVEVSMSCVNQRCAISDSPTTNIEFVQRLGTGGVGSTWRTSYIGSAIATAVMSDDKTLLSMTLCNTPVGTDVFSRCSFYTFKNKI